MNVTPEEKIEDYNVQVFGVYLSITINLIFLHIFNILRAQAEDEILGIKGKKYPNIHQYVEIIAVLLIIGTGIFLYYSYEELQERIDEQQKTGRPTSLAPYYEYFYVKILQFAAAVLFFHDVFFVDIEEPSFLRF